MCLFTFQIMPIKARRQITVYKVVKRKYKKRKPIYTTPIMKRHVYLNQPMVDEGRKMPKDRSFFTKKGDYVNISKRPRKDAKPIYTIEEGYIHCCATIDDAIRWIETNRHLFPSNGKSILKYMYNWAIIECTIEPGTLYYKSFENDQLCAKSLTPKNIVLEAKIRARDVFDY